MTSCPATVALPVVGRSSVVSMRRLVDFPAPFGPRNATSSPAPTSMSRPRTASIVSLPTRNSRVSPRAWIIVPPSHLGWLG